jgi:SAM-dependent methyltransferase
VSTADDHLEEAFGKAQPAHFEWQTSGPFVSERERELVRAAFLPLGDRVLDVGCGEGATLLHLGSPKGAVGVDLFEDKLVFARARIPDCRFVTASADALPFGDAAFDHLLVRDVIHHLSDPPGFVDEARRVLAAGGRIDVLEPCRYNPLIALHALTKPAERGELRSTMSYLTGLLGKRFRVVETHRYQAMPLHRIAFHPEMGRPSLGGHPLARAAVGGLERLASRLVPRFAWAYLHARAIAD